VVQLAALNEAKLIEFSKKKSYVSCVTHPPASGDHSRTRRLLIKVRATAITHAYRHTARITIFFPCVPEDANLRSLRVQADSVYATNSIHSSADQNSLPQLPISRAKSPQRQTKRSAGSRIATSLFLLSVSSLLNGIFTAVHDK
jgi:hypothetical protein